MLPFEEIIAQNNIDFSRPEEASLIEDSIVNWMLKLQPGSHIAYLQSQDDTGNVKVNDYINHYVSYVPKTFNSCPPDGPDDDIFMNCDSIYYFSENGQKYALLLIKHGESAQFSSYVHPQFYNPNSLKYNGLSAVILKYNLGVWLIDFYKDISNTMNVSFLLDGGMYYSFSMPNLHIFRRNLIIAETQYSEMIYNFSSIYKVDSTYLYDLNYKDPLFKFKSYSEPFIDNGFNEKLDTFNCGVNLYFEFLGNKPHLKFNYNEKYVKNKTINNDDYNFNKDIIDKTKREMLEFSKSSIDLYELIDKITEKPNEYFYAPPKYFPKKYDKLSDKEAYDIIAGKSLSYYYKSDSFNNNNFFFGDCACGSCLLPYVDHLFLTNGEYYKISNDYRYLSDICNCYLPLGRMTPFGCVDLFPELVEKGNWQIVDGKLILSINEEGYYKKEVKYGDIFEDKENDTLIVKFRGRSGWPLNDTVDINVFSNLESLLYEIAESECRFGYSIGDPLFQKQAATSGEIKLTNKPFGLGNFFYKCEGDYIQNQLKIELESSENAMTIEKFSALINSYYKKLDR